MAQAPSLTEQYFIGLFQAATLRGAVELAARQEQAGIGILRGFEEVSLNDPLPVPIDLKEILARKQIQVREGLDESVCPDARLVPGEGGFVVQLKPGLTKNRKRFALAHEVGHTLFYRDRGDGLKHQVGTLSKKEMMVEEKVCNMFARALLMPTSSMCDSMSAIPSQSPWAVLTLLNRLADKLNVSVPAIMMRLSEMEIESPPYAIVCFRLMENRFTRADRCLRVQLWSCLGGAKNIWMWNNRSAEGVNLRSAVALFDTWRHQLCNNIETTGGQYILDAKKELIRAMPQSVVEVQENVNVSVQSRGQWRKASLPVKIANCLYVGPGHTESEAAIISVLAIPE